LETKVSRYARRIFGWFTERARQVLVLSQDEARVLKHYYVGTEHILLGLLRVEEGLAARVLESLDITVEEVRAQVARIVGQGDEVTTGQIPFTPRAKKVLELSLQEAASLGHNYIGTEHILLGLMRENEGVAARILLDLDADAAKVRSEVVHMLSPPPDVIEFARPIPREVVDELEELRAEKIVAIDARDLERAAKLGARERRLMRDVVSEVSEAMEGFVERVVPSGAGRVAETRLWIALGFVLATIAFPLGLLVGWLVWG
jgi:ATP-dependent Clp protease ATP-binding subunit ClpA